MNVLDKLVSILLMVAGIAIWSIDYFIVKTIATIGTWLAELMNAPAAVGTGITLLISILIIGVLVLVIVVGAAVFMLGVEWWSE